MQHERNFKYKKLEKKNQNEKKRVNSESGQH